LLSVGDSFVDFLVSGGKRRSGLYHHVWIDGDLIDEHLRLGGGVLGRRVAGLVSGGGLLGGGLRGGRHDDVRPEWLVLFNDIYKQTVCILSCRSSGCGSFSRGGRSSCSYMTVIDVDRRGIVSTNAR